MSPFQRWRIGVEDRSVDRPSKRNIQFRYPGVPGRAGSDRFDPALPPKRAIAGIEPDFHLRSGRQLDRRRRLDLHLEQREPPHSDAARQSSRLTRTLCHKSLRT